MLPHPDNINIDTPNILIPVKWFREYQYQIRYLNSHKLLYASLVQEEFNEYCEATSTQHIARPLRMMHELWDLVRVAIIQMYLHNRIHNICPENIQGRILSEMKQNNKAYHNPWIRTYLILPNIEFIIEHVLPILELSNWTKKKPRRKWLEKIQKGDNYIAPQFLQLAKYLGHAELQINFDPSHDPYFYPQFTPWKH